MAFGLGFIKSYSDKRSCLNEPTKSKPLAEIKKLAKDLQRRNNREHLPVDMWILQRVLFFVICAPVSIKYSNFSIIILQESRY